LIDEINRLAGGLKSNGVIRIPPEIDVPITPRVRRLIDCPDVRRLKQISQLGLVSLVYPGATHSRWEHTLGVYRNALRVLQILATQSHLSEIVDERGAEAFVVAAIMHDVGHWPFCHPLEDIRMPFIPRHETRAGTIVRGERITELMGNDWLCDADDVMSILAKEPTGQTSLSADAVSLLSSCLSGPVDIDKLDYLIRDSLHAGVPYGRNFDDARLLHSLTIHPAKPRLAISEKGRTAAEMMVFARYVMFSEVYWHHAVRSATAMLQRLVFEFDSRSMVADMFDQTESAWIETVLHQSGASSWHHLADDLFGPARRLYKRVAEFSVLDRGDLQRELAHRPYWWLVACADAIAVRCASELRIDIKPGDILIDAPPVKLEVDINMDVVMRNGEIRTLADVSPVAQSLAARQFDGHVKRVRIFVRPQWRDIVMPLMQNDRWIGEVIEATEREVV